MNTYLVYCCTFAIVPWPSHDEIPGGGIRMRVDIEEDVGKPICLFHPHDVVANSRRSVVSHPDWALEDMKLQFGELWHSRTLENMKGSRFLFLEKSVPTSSGSVCLHSTWTRFLD